MGGVPVTVIYCSADDVDEKRTAVDASPNPTAPAPRVITNRSTQLIPPLALIIKKLKFTH